MSPLKNDFVGAGTEPASAEERERRLLAIGQFFEQHRLAAKLNLAELAHLLEVEVDVLVAYESGQIRIPLEDMFVMTNILNIAPEDLFAMISDVYGHLK